MSPDRATPVSYVDTCIERMDQVKREEEKRLKTEAKMRESRMFMLGQCVSNLEWFLMKERKELKKLK